MIFTVSDSKHIEQITIGKIHDHTDLNDFLELKPPVQYVLICPTNAIDIEKKKILTQCIDCGLCWIQNKDKIIKTSDQPNYSSFKDYILKDKMFIYKWICLSISEFSGINIKSTGFSRTKRIPLLVINGDTVYFFKSVRDIGDIESANLELEDILSLIGEDLKDYYTIKIIIIINDFDHYKSVQDLRILKLSEIYEKFVVQEKFKMTEILK